MGNSNNSGSLSRGDVFSFIAILSMAALLFFGLNFYTVNLAVSLIAAISFLVVEFLFLSLAVHAKQQDNNLRKYSSLESLMIGLYIIVLVPVYIFATPFFNVQTNRRIIIETEGPSEIMEVRNLFSEFDESCQHRKTSYQNLMSKSLTGGSSVDKDDLSAIFGESRPTPTMISDEADNQFNMWETTEYRKLYEEMDGLATSFNHALQSWDLVHLPHIASMFSKEKVEYPEKLAAYYENTESYTYFEKKSDADDIQFTFKKYKCCSISERYFHKLGFSVSGFFIFVILAIVGFMKYIATSRSNKILPSMGKSDNEFKINL